MPEAPVPITPTRLPVKSTGSRGHIPVCSERPAKLSAPLNSGMFAVDRQPTAVMTKRAVAVWPCSVRSVHRFSASSYSTAIDPGAEGEVLAQIEAVRDMFQVAEDLGLARIAFLQRPLLLQVRHERERVVHDLGVAARARVAVPVPGPAHAVALLEAVDGEPLLAQPVQHVQAGEAGPDDHRVERPGFCGSADTAASAMIGAFPWNVASAEACIVVRSPARGARLRPACPGGRAVLGATPDCPPRRTGADAGHGGRWA